MTDMHQAPRRRSRTAQHLYTARYPGAEYTPNEETPKPQTYAPNEETAQPDWAGYTPNGEIKKFAPNEEPQQDWNGYTPNEPDLSAYYSRESETQTETAQPAFAPPPKMNQYGFVLDDPAPASEEEEAPAQNVYRPREVTWSDEPREELSEAGYEVQEEKPRKKKRKKRRGRAWVWILLLLVLMMLAAWLLRGPLMERFAKPSATDTPQPFTVVATPEPIKAYDAAPAPAVADTARNAIAQLSGTVDMETYIVTDQHIVTRNRRANGTYDFYLFTAQEGRLLCYFEGLDALDMIPQEGGSFHVQQAPWLIAPNGSALIRTEDPGVRLHPLYRGWTVMETEDGSFNYLSTAGQKLSTLWFCRAFPFTGEHTLAYVDTGSTAEQRYLLYVLSSDGTMSRWLAAQDMTDAVVSACGLAYMNDGALYHLPDTSAPMLKTTEAHVYLDCNALVVRDSVTGKYGLFVDGEQHYDFIYDSILPLSSDMNWAEKTFSGEGGSFTLHAVSGAAWPQPLSHSFELKKGEESEYVALSTQSSYPIRLDGEF